MNPKQDRQPRRRLASWRGTNGAQRKPAGRALATLLLIAAVLVGAPATSAAASTLNTRSDHAALAAYSGYLRALVTRVSIGSIRDRQLTAMAQRTCPGYLAPYAARMTRGSGLALGAEVGGDLAVRYTSAAAVPFRRLSSRLNALQWSSPHPIVTIGRFIAAERNLMAIRVSRLCADVIDLGGHPRYVGPGTRRFDLRLARATRSADAALRNFVRLLETYEARGDRHLITLIDHRSSVYLHRTAAVQRRARKQLLTAIGIRTLS